MSTLSILSRQTWLRSLGVSSLALFLVVGVVFGATTISTNIETGGTLTVTGTSTLNGTTDLNGQVDIGDGGDTITINGSDVSLTDPHWSVTGAGAGTLTSLNVGSATATHINGVNDLLVGDSVEVDGSVYVEGTLFAYGDSYIGNQSTDAVTFNSTPTFNYDVIIGNDGSDSLQVNSTATFDSAVIFTGNTYHQGNVYTYGPTSIGDGASEAHTVTGIMTFNNNMIVNGDATLGNGGGTMTIGHSGATDNIIITDAQWSITGGGAAEFSGLSVAGISEFDGDILLGDISGSGMLMELNVSTNDFFLGGNGTGSIQIGDGGGDSIFIGNGGGDGVTLGGGLGDQIVLGGTGGDQILIGSNGGTGDSIDIGTDGGAVSIETNTGYLEVGTGGATIGAILNATADLDFSSTALGSCSAQTLIVSGANTGDTVFLGAPSTIETGLTWSGFVSATNTVNIRLCNFAGTNPLDPASATWSATVFQMVP